MTQMSSYLRVMTERDNPSAEARGVWNVDAAAIVEETIVFRSFHRSERARGGSLKFLDSFGHRFLLQTLTSLADVPEDVLFWSSEL